VVLGIARGSNCWHPRVALLRSSALVHSSRASTFSGGRITRVTGLLVLAFGIVGHATSASADAPRASCATPRLTVVVHRGGGRVVAGEYDNARRWVSHTLKTTGRSEVTIPAFEGSDAEWRGMLSCARSLYAGLPVDFVEKPPAAGDYLMMVVGGSARSLGLTRIWGYSSTGARAVVPNGVGFLFSADHPDEGRTDALCVTLTHEVGHMIGLDHSTDCTDVMSTTVECKHRDTSHRLRGFQQANRSTLASSLATWAQSRMDEETRIADDAKNKTQKTRALVNPRSK